MINCHLIYQISRYNNNFRFSIRLGIINFFFPYLLLFTLSLFYVGIFLLHEYKNAI